jgi:hypothetical protein
MLIGKHEARRPLENLGVDGRLTLKCILKKQGMKMGTEFNGVSKQSSGMLLSTR